MRRMAGMSPTYRMLHLARMSATGAGCFWPPAFGQCRLWARYFCGDLADRELPHHSTILMLQNMAVVHVRRIR